jgi:thiol-disulfide isomerase/thioredoxin/uncharacterized membrane protein YphA (DoxX/SURF4 family)
MGVALLACRLVLSALFLTAGLTKFADMAGASKAASDFGVPPSLARLVGTALPVVEVAAAAALVPLPSARIGAVAIAALLVSFSAAIANAMAHGRAPECHCFGQVSSARVGWRALARNLVLLAVATFVAAAGWRRPGLSATHWLTEVGAPWLVTIGAALVLLSLIGFLGWFALQLLAQNGRVLSRLEALELSLQAVSVGLGLHSSDRSSPDVPALLGEGLSGAGLPVGNAAPPFSLDVAGGGHLSLSDLLAEQRPLVLVFVSVGCGPCEALLPRLAEWQDRFRDRLTFAVVASGQRQELDKEAAGRRLRPVLVQAQREVAEAFAIFGTPSAVVVGVDGAVLSPTVGGSEQIATLVHQAAARSTAGLRRREPARVAEVAERGASPVGAPAPDVVLHDLDGREVALSDFYGGTRLVLFWDPGCGYCRRMLPQLQALGEGGSGGPPRVIVVSTGEVADIREQAIPEPLLHDPRGLAMRAFGAGGTPMGVLVKEGEVASSVVAGADAVLRLLSEAELGTNGNGDRALVGVARAHIVPSDRTRDDATQSAPGAAP